MQVKLDELFVRRLVWPDKRDDPYVRVAQLELENGLLKGWLEECRTQLKALREPT